MTIANALNTAAVLSLSGSLTTSGAFGLTLTVTALTNVTLPITGTLAALGGTNDWSAANTFSVNGATSVPAVNLSGTPFAGNGTTSYPLFYFNNAGRAQPTALSSSGTFFGANGPSGFAGNYFHFCTNGGAAIATLTAAGVLTVTSTLNSNGGTSAINQIQMASAASLIYSSRSKILSPSDGTVLLQNNGNTAFTRLIFGVNTTLGCAIIVSTITMGFTLGDGTGNADITAGTWKAQVVAGQYGGTGVANTSKTITLGGSLVTSGAFDTTLTATATTNVTLPTTGTLATLAGTETLTNKRITKRRSTVASSATPTINSDNVDIFAITALATAITSMTTNLSGTPTPEQPLIITITDDGTARAITWGSSFASTTNGTLPTTTVISTRLRIILWWNDVTSKWDCVGVT